jgi:HAD superfamily hydrolase (TIGR01509 family)
VTDDSTVNDAAPTPPPTSRSAVIFDLDGTLVDSNYLHTLAWSRALQAAGEWAPMNAIHRLIGMGSDQLLPQVIGRTDDDIASQRDAEYKLLIDGVVAFPGAERLLRAVRRLGLLVVLATSSAPSEYEAMVELIGGAQLIDAHTTIEDVSHSKPDPEIFQRALTVAHTDPSRAIVVGDSPWDIKAAAGAGMACLAVETGGSSRAELIDAGALHVFRDVDQLADELLVSPIGLLAVRAMCAEE